MQAIKREHCNAEDSVFEFAVPNYGTQTKSKIEYYFVAEPENGYAECEIERYPMEDEKKLTEHKHQRRAEPVSHFDAAKGVRNEQLQQLDSPPLLDQEFVGARLCARPRIEHDFHIVLPSFSPGVT